MTSDEIVSFVIARDSVRYLVLSASTLSIVVVGIGWVVVIVVVVVCSCNAVDAEISTAAGLSADSAGLFFLPQKARKSLPPPSVLLGATQIR